MTTNWIRTCSSRNHLKIANSKIQNAHKFFFSLSLYLLLLLFCNLLFWGFVNEKRRGNQKIKRKKMSLEIEFWLWHKIFIHPNGDLNFKKSFRFQSKSCTWQTTHFASSNNIYIKQLKLEFSRYSCVTITLIVYFGYWTYISITSWENSLDSSMLGGERKSARVRKYEKSRYLINRVGCKCTIYHVTEWMTSHTMH